MIAYESFFFDKIYRTVLKYLTYQNTNYTFFLFWQVSVETSTFLFHARETSFIVSERYFNAFHYFKRCMSIENTFELQNNMFTQIKLYFTGFYF